LPPGRVISVAEHVLEIHLRLEGIRRNSSSLDQAKVVLHPLRPPMHFAAITSECHQSTLHTTCYRVDKQRRVLVREGRSENRRETRPRNPRRPSSPRATSPDRGCPRTPACHRGSRGPSESHSRQPSVVPHANTSFTTTPDTSVSRKSRPWKRIVNR